MMGASPRFPAFEDWTKLTESEQDALLSRMEAARRRKSLLLWTTGVAATAMATYIAFAIWL